MDENTTNIANALQFGLAQAAGSSSPRIVLLTDGNENRGSAEQAAAVARALGARIFPVPLGSAAAPDAAGSFRRGHPRARARPAGRAAGGDRHGAQQHRDPRAGHPFPRREPVGHPREASLPPGRTRCSFAAPSPSAACRRGTRWSRRPATPVQQNNHCAALRGGDRRARRSSTWPGPADESPRLLAALAAQGITAVERVPAGSPAPLPATSRMTR